MSAFDPGSRPPPRHPLGRTCFGLLLLAPAWPVLIAAHLLRRHLTSAAAEPAGNRAAERAGDAAGIRWGAGAGRTTRPPRVGAGAADGRHHEPTPDGFGVQPDPGHFPAQGRVNPGGAR